MKLPLEFEFRDQAPRTSRKGSEALGNFLVTFTNEINNSLQIKSWLCMRSLWHGSKIDMSLAPKRKLSVLGGKGGIKVGDGEFAKSIVRGKTEEGDELNTKIAGFCMQERKLAL
ncbi:hypothetical protein Pyn_37413 [Prunus yedoensis var. nudiflora]|uniref:Uncharacterized protein n=1 Tax=Prunus yedoensis var. nudiflora TaxID=2094558 RepID=A0A314U959_PRUYE|nr:hypothetical protein Pyn_37413 [Prunus yedoensis var. nudiflora]